MKTLGNPRSGHVETLIRIAIISIVISFLLPTCTWWIHKKAVLRDQQEIVRVLNATIPEYESVEKIEEDKNRKRVYRTYFFMKSDRPRYGPHMAVIVIVKGIGRVESVDNVLFKPN